MKTGDIVTGMLFNMGKVIAVGTYSKLKRYDSSGAVLDGINEGLISKNDKLVAVKLIPDGGVYVYVQEEVFIHKRRK